MLVAAFLTCLVAFGAGSAAGALEAAEVEDGIYSVNATVVQAASESVSMANSAFVQPLQLTVKGGRARLDAKLQAAGQNGLSARLGFVRYYPDYRGSAVPRDEPATTARTTAYSDVTDSFNDPAHGTDATMKGRKYPSAVAMFTDGFRSELWMQVYVPFMEGLSAGSGLQFVRLRLDLASLQRTGDAPADMEGDEEGSAYVRLSEALAVADSYLTKSGSYTAESLRLLREARNAAQAVYDERSASEPEALAQAVALMTRIIMLEPLPASAAASAAPAVSAPAAGKLDMDGLADGTYTVPGTMVKADKSTTSMADAGINHNVTLEVSGGSCRLRLGLTNVSANGQSSYLSKLSYYKSGYKTGSSGTIRGTLAAAKVLSYQTSGGKRVRDAYGTDYPAEVQIPLISEARASGLVPLQVFVPVMEAIAAGSGTQQVYLKLDFDDIANGKKAASWSTAKKSAKSGSDSGSKAPLGALTASSALGSGVLDAAAGLAGGAAGDGQAAGTAHFTARELTPAERAGADEPPLRRHIAALILVPAGIVLLGAAYSALKRRRSLGGQGL